MLLTGVTIPVVTPFDAEGRPDVQALGGYYRGLARAGVTRILLLGSNGEGPLVPTADLEVFLAPAVREWRAAAGDGAVVMVNATAAGTREARIRAELSIAAGADAVVASPPIYFAHGDDEVVAHYEGLAGLGPIAAYNQPKYAAAISVAAAERLFELEHVVGMKDSSGDPVMLDAFLAAAGRHGAEVSTGAETRLLDGLDAGAAGIVPGVGNLAPRLAVVLADAWAAGDRAAAEQAQRTLAELTGIHRIHPGVASVKAALADLGLVAARTAPPLAPCDAVEAERIRAFLAPFAAELIGAVTR
ncbi:MAG: dihydrodipicolinate synthase family protein [Microbacterium sp.]